MRLSAAGCAPGERASSWRSTSLEEVSLEMIIGGAAFPMLGETYNRGAGALREIPMWAATILLNPRRGPQPRSHSPLRRRGRWSQLWQPALFTFLAPFAKKNWRERALDRQLDGALIGTMTGLLVLEPDQIARGSRQFLAQAWNCPPQENKLFCPELFWSPRGVPSGTPPCPGRPIRQRDCASHQPRRDVRSSRGYGPASRQPA